LRFKSKVIRSYRRRPYDRVAQVIGMAAVERNLAIGAKDGAAVGGGCDIYGTVGGE
jgi:hypothetical protein